MDDLERRLADARARMDRASEALRPKHKGGEWEEFHAAHDELIDAERALALERGEECALACDGFPPWDIGAPCPQLLSGSRGTILTYFVREPSPGWDGSSVRIVDVADDSLATIAIVRFRRVTAVRIGSPNDEVIEGHPLHGHGLVAYRAHVVTRSRWVHELQTINSVHQRYDPARWTDRKHYLLAFHDETFECVASGFDVEIRRSRMADVCRAALEEVLGTE